jgi:hypothetical protein
MFYSCGGIQHEALGGTIVAYEEIPTPEGCCQRWVVVVRDLRTGRPLRKVPTGTAPRAEEDFGIGPTTMIVVKSDGSVAWIVRPVAEGAYQVHAADNTGSKLLASGQDIDPLSLVLTGNTLTWKQGGTTYSATLAKLMWPAPSSRGAGYRAPDGS